MNFLSTHRKRNFLFTLLYASEGAPIGFIWWTLPTELRSLGMPIDQITALTSLLVLPWALKFLWAPFIDILRTPRWTLRSWILSTQTMMVLSLLPFVFLGLSAFHTLVVPLLLLHTISAATQDAAIDALCISEVPAAERGTVNGWMQAGMIFGRALFGGGAIAATRFFDMKTLIAGLLFFIATVLVIVFFVTPHGMQSTMPVKEKQKEFFSRMRQMLRSRTLWIGLLFAVFGGAAYESVGAVAGPLFVDNGVSKDEIGFFFSVLSVGAMLLGALAGGYMLKKIKLYNAVEISVVIVAVLVFFISILTSSEHHTNSTTLFSTMTALYFAIGLFTSSTYTLFMDLTDPKLGATHFSTYMGGTNICESLSAYMVGILIAQFGYSIAFAVMAGVSLLSLYAVFKLKQYCS